MRELKFRAWDKTREVFIEVPPLKDLLFSYGQNYDYTNGDDVELIQFTGLKDISGKEIYDGDIVSLWYAPQATAKGRIKFENGGFYFKTTEAKPEICLAYNCVYEHGNSFTVIGNIYENPELLESKDETKN